MRRFLLTMLCLTLLCAPCAALADSDVSELFEAIGEFMGITVDDALCAVSQLGDTAAVCRLNGDQLELYMLRYDGAWQVDDYCANVLADGSVVKDGIFADGVIIDFKNEQYCVLRSSIGTEVEFSWENGAWQLTWLLLTSTNAVTYDVIHVADGSLTFSDSLMGLVDDTVYGAVPRRLSEFDYSTFPKDIDAARALLAQTETTESTAGELTVQVVELNTSLTYALFVGPGEEYGRTEDGAGVIRLPATLAVFGRIGEWMMVEGQDGGSIGWMDANALPAGVTVPQLEWDGTELVATADTMARTDPDNAETEFRVVAAGDEMTALATLNGWTYVDFGTLTPRLGFVPSDVLAEVMETTPEPTALPTEEPVGRSIDEIFADYTVRGSLVRTNEVNGEIAADTASLLIALTPGQNVPDSDIPVTYRVMLNQTVLGEAERILEGNGVRRFMMELPLPQEDAVIALCPVFEDGELHSGEVILMRVSDLGSR